MVVRSSNKTKLMGNLLYEISFKGLNTTWRRYANQLCTRVECIPETTSTTVDKPLTEAAVIGLLS